MYDTISSENLLAHNTLSTHKHKTIRDSISIKKKKK